jgi:hypothetical protein
LNLAIRASTWAVVAAALAAAAADAVAQEPAGLVSRYEAEGNANDTLGANPATAVGNVTYAAGKYGQGFSLDGASHVDVAAPTFDAYDAGFTVSARMRMTAYAGTASLVNLRTPTNNSGFALEQLFNQPGSIVVGVNQTGVAEDFELLSAPGWKTGVLYHCAFTFDGPSGSLILYRDGKPVAARHDLLKQGMAPSPGAHLQIGRNIANGQSWNGLIDDVRYYGRALTPSEVGSLATPSSLVAHWRFDEQPGATTARDDLGGYDGTLAGGAAFAAGGISGNCMSLDEATSSLVNMGTSFPGFTSGDFTLVAWVKTTSAATNSFAVGKHQGGSFNGYFLAVNGFGSPVDYSAAGKAALYVSAVPGQEATSTTSVADGAWHMIVGVHRAGATESVYVDGGPAESTNAAQAMIGNAASFLIGGVESGGSPTATYTGLVDDVQVYSSALTDAQIQYLFAHPGRAVPTLQFDLATDWSDDLNPNGAWTYREGTNALPHVAWWQRTFGGYSAAQPAWARSEDGNDRAPVWYRSLGLETSGAVDLEAGDVVVHTNNDPGLTGNGNANVIWTSPFTGTVDISGSLWPGQNIGRSNDWFVYRNATLLTQGSLVEGGAFSRANPLDLTAGSGGEAALRDVAVAAGDVLRLEFQKTAQFGDLVGANLAVSVPSSAATVSYFLPKKVALKLLGAGKDSLTATGYYDDGGAAVDLTQPVTITVGGFSRQFQLTGNAKGTAFTFKDATASLLVKPKQKGSSRGSFILKLTKQTLAGQIDPTGEIELHFQASGLPDAVGRVKLTNGGYALGKVRGALLLPAFFPSKAKIASDANKPDAVALTGGFAWAGATPTTLGRVRIAVGPTFELVIAGDAFTKTGDKFTHKTSAMGRSVSVTIDFAKAVVVVKTKGVEVGELPAGSMDVLADLGTGVGPVTSRVRFGGTGTKRSY